MFKAHNIEAAIRQFIFQNNILYWPRVCHVKKQNCREESSQFAEVYFKSSFDDLNLNVFGQKIGNILQRREDKISFW